MKILKTIIDFLFFRWEQTIEKQGTEVWANIIHPIEFPRDFVIYRFTHKFSKRTYLKKVYFDKPLIIWQSLNTVKQKQQTKL